MTNQHGRNYEHELCNGLNVVTPEEVWASTVGYSGNASSDDCDIVITVDPKLRVKYDPIQINLEAKKRQGDGGKRVSSVFGGSKDDETGVEEIERLVDSTPEWGDPVIALKFDRRKLIVLDARWLLVELGERKHPIAPEHVQDLFDVLQPRLTPSDSISMVKPTTDDWSSARAANADELVLADQLGLPIEEPTEHHKGEKI